MGHPSGSPPPRSAALGVLQCSTREPSHAPPGLIPLHCVQASVCPVRDLSQEPSISPLPTHQGLEKQRENGQCRIPAGPGRALPSPQRVTAGREAFAEGPIWSSPATWPASHEGLWGLALSHQGLPQAAGSQASVPRASQTNRRPTKGLSSLRPRGGGGAQADASKWPPTSPFPRTPPCDIPAEGHRGLPCPKEAVCWGGGGDSVRRSQISRAEAPSQCQRRTDLAWHQGSRVQRPGNQSIGGS